MGNKKRHISSDVARPEYVAPPPRQESSAFRILLTGLVVIMFLGYTMWKLPLLAIGGSILIVIVLMIRPIVSTIYFIFDAHENLLFKRAERKRAQNEASYDIIKGSQGELIIRETDHNGLAVYRSAHIDPRVTWSVSQAAIAVTADEEWRWSQFRQTIHARGGAGAPNPAEVAIAPQIAPASLPDRIDFRDIAPSRFSVNGLVLGVHVEKNGLEPVKLAMSNSVNVAIGGSPGGGKSVLLQLIGYQLVLSADPVAVTAIDLHNSSLNVFKDCPRLLYPLATTEREALAVVQGLHAELEDRKAWFAAKGVETLDDYNRLLVDEPLKPVVALIDEGNDLFEIAQISDYVQKLCRASRKYGIWLVMAAQEWNLMFVDSRIRRMLMTAFQYAAADSTQIRMLVGSRGARLLSDDPPEGRAVARLRRHGLFEMQTAYIARPEIEAALAGQSAPYEPPQFVESTAIVPLPEPERQETDEEKFARFAELVRTKAVSSRNEAALKVFGKNYAGTSFVNRCKEALGEL